MKKSTSDNTPNIPHNKISHTSINGWFMSFATMQFINKVTGIPKRVEIDAIFHFAALLIENKKYITHIYVVAISDIGIPIINMNFVSTITLFKINRNGIIKTLNAISDIHILFFSK